ncbi:hypothetical protein IE53DRAFT_228149 [Violaceomyces palustris]|uniref:Uncharacterized protein n=1 Tax=Violaceomyces palustris TaxID=1673888 RepID=A0ACD0NPT8_9BASI|nr:hypothetical protein IE53DRAFT_228149 [Violaceomyces palustris]
MKKASLVLFVMAAISMANAAAVHKVESVRPSMARSDGIKKPGTLMKRAGEEILGAGKGLAHDAGQGVSLEQLSRGLSSSSLASMSDLGLQGERAEEVKKRIQYRLWLQKKRPEEIVHTVLDETYKEHQKKVAEQVIRTHNLVLEDQRAEKEGLVGYKSRVLAQMNKEDGERELIKVDDALDFVNSEHKLSVNAEHKLSYMYMLGRYDTTELMELLEVNETVKPRDAEERARIFQQIKLDRQAFELGTVGHESEILARMEGRQGKSVLIEPNDQVFGAAREHLHWVSEMDKESKKENQELFVRYTYYLHMGEPVKTLQWLEEMRKSGLVLVHWDGDRAKALEEISRDMEVVKGLRNEPSAILGLLWNQTGRVSLLRKVDEVPSTWRSPGTKPDLLPSSPVGSLGGGGGRVEGLGLGHIPPPAAPPMPPNDGVEFLTGGGAGGGGIGGGALPSGMRTSAPPVHLDDHFDLLTGEGGGTFPSGMPPGVPPVPPSHQAVRLTPHLPLYNQGDLRNGGGGTLPSGVPPGVPPAHFNDQVDLVAGGGGGTLPGGVPPGVPPVPPVPPNRQDFRLTPHAPLYNQGDLLGGGGGGGGGVIPSGTRPSAPPAYLDPAMKFPATYGNVPEAPTQEKPTGPTPSVPENAETVAVGDGKVSQSPAGMTTGQKVAMGLLTAGVATLTAGTIGSAVVQGNRIDNLQEENENQDKRLDKQAKAIEKDRDAINRYLKGYNLSVSDDPPDGKPADPPAKSNLGKRSVGSMHRGPNSKLTRRSQNASSVKRAWTKGEKMALKLSLAFGLPLSFTMLAMSIMNGHANATLHQDNYRQDQQLDKQAEENRKMREELNNQAKEIQEDRAVIDRYFRGGNLATPATADIGGQLIGPASFSPAYPNPPANLAANPPVNLPPNPAGNPPPCPPGPGLSKRSTADMPKDPESRSKPAAFVKRFEKLVGEGGLTGRIEKRGAREDVLRKTLDLHRLSQVFPNRSNEVHMGSSEVDISELKKYIDRLAEEDDKTMAHLQHDLHRSNMTESEIADHMEDLRAKLRKVVEETYGTAEMERYDKTMEWLQQMNDEALHAERKEVIKAYLRANPPGKMPWREYLSHDWRRIAALTALATGAGVSGGLIGAAIEGGVAEGNKNSTSHRKRSQTRRRESE